MTICIESLVAGCFTGLFTFSAISNAQDLYIFSSQCYVCFLTPISCSTHFKLGYGFVSFTRLLPVHAVLCSWNLAWGQVTISRSQYFVTLATDGHSGTTYMMKHIYNFLPEICILSPQSLYVCSSLESVLILRSPKNSTTLVNIQTLPEVYTFMEELAVEKPCWWISSMNRVLWKRNKEFTFTNLCWMFTTVSEYENV